jgi:hypothetical protein
MPYLMTTNRNPVGFLALDAEFLVFFTFPVPLSSSPTSGGELNNLPLGLSFRIFFVGDSFFRSKPESVPFAGTGSGLPGSSTFGAGDWEFEEHGLTSDDACSSR